jgi:outer membrane receptor protein involved in Fe transport
MSTSLARFWAKHLALLTILSFALPFGLQAQENSGQVSGTVKDASGAGVPAAKVEMTSPNLPKPLLATTGEDGSFVFLRVAPGVYSVNVSKDGFSKFTQRNLDVKLGSAINLAVPLKVGAVSEVIEVSESAISIDPTSSQSSTNITASTFDALPKGRNFHTLLAMAPGVRYEVKNGNAGVGGFQVDGASGSENAFLIDGVDTSDIRRGSLRQQNSIPFEFIQEIQIKSSGFGAEFGGATGGVVNVITKGGSNDFHGFLQFQYTGSKLNPRPRGYWQRSPLNANASDFFAPKEDKYGIFYPGFDLGGPILKNSLFFRTSYMPEYEDRQRDIAYASGARTFTRQDVRHYWLNRVDWTPFSKLQLYSSWVWSPLRQTGSLPSPDVRLVAPTNDQSILGGFQPAQTFTLGGNYSITSRWLVSARFGYKYQNDKVGNYGLPLAARINYLTASSASPVAVPAAFAGPNGFANISNNIQTNRDVTTRQNLYIDSSYVAKLGGQQHIFKFGYARARVTNDVETYYPNGFFQVYWGDRFNRGSIQNQTGTYGYYIWQDGVRNLGNVNGKNQGFYVQDAWQLRKNLTLNIGARFENEFLPPYKAEVNGRKVQNPISFNWADKIAPRLGVAWDVMGDGKWKVAGSFGLYYDVLKYELARGSFGGDYWVSHVYRLDNPNVYALGLSTPGAGGPKITQYDNRTLPINAAGEIEGIDPNIKPYAQREFTASLTHQLTSSLVASVRYVRKDLLRAIEDIGVLDAEENEQYIIGNPGFGLSADTKSVYGGKTPNGKEFLVPKATRQYDGVEFNLSGRFLKKTTFNTSYTYSRLYGNYSGSANSDEAGRSDPGVSRAFDLPYYYFDATGSQKNVLGRLGTDRPHTFKAFIGHELNTKAGNTFFGVNQIAYSGTLDSTTIIYLSAPTFPYGRGDLGRTPILTQTDLSVSHTIKLGERTSLRLDANAVNIFNQASVVARVSQYNRNGALSINPDAAPGGFFAGYDPKRFFLPNAASNAFNPIYGLPGGAVAGGGAGAYQGPREIRLGARISF